MVFAEAWWVGKTESNLKEERLPIPESVLQAGAKAAGANACTNVRLMQYFFWPAT